MRIADLLRGTGDPAPHFSFEFFPPKDAAGEAALLGVMAELRDLNPAFVSVTDGAMGATRGRTLGIVTRARDELGLTPLAHFNCVGASRDELHEVLAALEARGIENVLALRGDPPRGVDAFTPAPDGLAFASELVELIAGRYAFCVGAAAYPEVHVEAASAEADLHHLKTKVDAGAEFLVTQLFFDNDAYFAFVARCREAGIDVPIVPGVMPVTNVKQIERFTSMCGATIPEPLRAALRDRADDPGAVCDLGVAWATLQCQDLLSRGAPGVHFYTLNKSPATRAIVSALRAGAGLRRPALA